MRREILGVWLIICLRNLSDGKLRKNTGVMSGSVSGSLTDKAVAWKGGEWPGQKEEGSG